MKKHISILSFLLVTNFSFAQDSFWNQVSGPKGGMVSYFDETDDNTLFLGEHNTGSLWFHDNSRGKWEKFEHESLNILRYFGVDENRIYVQGSSRAFYSGHDIYYSDDLGASWIASGLNRSTDRMWIAPDKTLYALANDTLYRAENRAEHWIPVQVNEKYSFNYNLSIDVQGSLYACYQDRLEISKDMGDTWNVIPFYEYAFLSEVLFGPKTWYTLSTSGRDGKLYRSFNNGDTWEGLTIRDQVDIQNLYLHASGKLFGSNYDGLYTSDDNGETWEISLDFENSYIEQLEFKGEDEVFLLLNGKLFYSQNMGDSWTIQNSDDMNLGKVHLASDGNMYSTPYNQGVWRSEDDGKTWESFNEGYENINLNKLVVDHGGNLYGINQYENGMLYTSSNLGQTWNNVDSINFYDIQINDQGTLYAIGGDRWNNNQIVYSKDNGANWNQLSWTHGKGPRKIVLGSNGLVTVVAEGENWTEWLFQTIDNGTTWNTIQTNLTDGDYSAITDFHITPNGNYLLSTYDSYFWSRPCYLSTDEGLTWEQLDIYGQQFITDSNNGVLVVGELSGFLFKESSLKYSKDNGVSWTTLAEDNLYSASIPDYYIDFRSNVYSIKSDTLSISVNSGESWELLDVSSITNRVKHLTIAHDKNLYTLTRDNKIYSTNIPPIPLRVPQQITHTSLDISNYPNPFLDYTTIDYVLEQESLVSLAIYDISGNLVQELIQDDQPEGTYSVKWDRKDIFGNRVASGLYIYKIQVNDTYKSSLIIAK